jgi:cytochrome c
MKCSKTLIVMGITLLSVALCAFLSGQDKVTPQDVVNKVKDAVAVLSKTGDLKQFDQKQGPWVWGGTYIFVQNCNTKMIAAHPIKPELVGQDFMTLKDSKGNPLFKPDYCTVARTASGVWSEYWWPKPGATESSRKITYSLGAKGTPYVVVGSVYDDNLTIAEASKLTGTN